MAVAYVRIYRVAKQQQQHIYSLTYSMGQCIVNLDQVIPLTHTYTRNIRTHSELRTDMIRVRYDYSIRCENFGMRFKM